MRTLSLNIGLENCPLDCVDVYAKVKENLNLKNIIFIIDFVVPAVEDGTYNENPEDTLVIKSETPYKLSTVIRKIEELCSVLNQECIAATIDGNGILIYNVSFTKKRQSFNPKYFVTL